jgi:hypothetical protein
MEDKLKDFLSSCSEIDFGAVNLSNGEKEFRRELNNEVVSLCKSLPESTQPDALLFFMRYFRIPFGQELSIFSNYYVPAWSITYWLIQSATEGKELEQRYKQNAKIAHSMALFLHPLDDHLNDGQLQATHLTLLLRSQAWTIMNNALSRLADEVDGGGGVVEGFLDNYYSSIKSSKEIVSLDNYCDHFRKQMATWLIVPVLLTKKMATNEQFTDAIQTAYGSFGIAWRLLDDINDIQIDMMKGAHSSIYTCLPEDIKNYWEKHSGDELDKENGYFKIVLDYILENSVIDRVRERICSELKSAASIADDCKMTSWAAELLCLLRPLQNSQD